MMNVMKLMMKLPDDIFRHMLLPYLTLRDLGRLDNMCMNHEYRPQVLDKIRGVIISMVGSERYLCMQNEIHR